MVVEHDYEQYPELTNQQLEQMPFDSPHPQITEDFVGTVERVTDGDTLTLTTSFRDFSFPLRLLDIDAPELNEGGERSKEWLRAKVEGKEVQVLIDPKQRVGKYGRLLGKVVYAGLDVGEEMISLGYAFRFGEKDEFNPDPANKIFDLRQWF